MELNTAIAVNLTSFCATTLLYKIEVKEIIGAMYNIFVVALEVGRKGSFP